MKIRKSKRSSAPPKAQKERSSTALTVKKAFAVLEMLADCDGCGVSDLSRRLGLSVTTAHRILSTLMSLGYVMHDSATSPYRLSSKVLLISNQFLERLSVHKVATRHLKILASRWNETVNLAAVESGHIVYVEKIQSTEPLRLETQVGTRLDAHCSALGKAICAGMSRGELDAHFFGRPLRKFTRNTNTDYADLVRHLEQVRDRGYAIDDEERHAGIRAVAAPIRDWSGRVIAAVSVAAPTIRMNDAELRKLTPDVIATAHAISREMGAPSNDARGRAPRSTVARKERTQRAVLGSS